MAKAHHTKRASYELAAHRACVSFRTRQAMSKYAVFLTLKGEAIARAMEQPSDRVTVVSKAVESAPHH
jgi:hypothetical protein